MFYSSKHLPVLFFIHCCYMTVTRPFIARYLDMRKRAKNSVILILSQLQLETGIFSRYIQNYVCNVVSGDCYVSEAIFWPGMERKNTTQVLVFGPFMVWFPLFSVSVSLWKLREMDNWHHVVDSSSFDGQSRLASLLPRSRFTAQPQKEKLNPWFVRWLFCFIVHQPISGHLTLN